MGSMVEPDCEKNFHAKFTPYDEFLALRHTVLEMQDAVRTSCSSPEALATKADIDKFKREKEFLKKKDCTGKI